MADEHSIEIRILGTTRCRAVHLPTGATVETDAAPEFGGGGTSFSSTDLLAVALGTCIGSSIAPILEREGISAEHLVIRVTKKLKSSPKRIEQLDVDIHLPARLIDKQLRKLRGAARSCVVHRSLSEEIAVDVKLVTEDV